MKNITVSISNEAHRAARVWAAERRTSLSKTVAYLLETLTQMPLARRRFPLPGKPADQPTRAVPWNSFPDPEPDTPLPPAPKKRTVKP
jgi:hypothetical protein